MQSPLSEQLKSMNPQMFEEDVSVRKTNRTKQVLLLGRRMVVLVKNAAKSAADLE